MRINLGEDEQPEIGLIALIDCIFFLLMFFMVASSFKKPDTTRPPEELPVTLPSAQASIESSKPGPAPLVIGVDKDGKFYLGNQAVSTQTLHHALKQEAKINPARAVRIDGDEHAKYQDIVHVLDLCQFEGLTKISLNTRK
jgi:biopolymer transport protein ExbD